MAVHYGYARRLTREVAVGQTAIGGDNPIRLQSMTSTSTMDTDASVAQVRRIADAGADIVRLTAQGIREATNLTAIRSALRAEGCNVPLVADIHFNPRAAIEAAGRVEKVRINPGNFADPGRTFRKIEYTDEEYAAERRKINDALKPLIDVCQAHGTALRIGVNHGSLSDRIMSRYGDTPEGMTESAMEYLRACRELGFDRIVVSVKASNVAVMVNTVRMLAAAMDSEGMNFPFHLGVTEAGDGEDGRIKSAVGIGALLTDGIGDTIRVSLSEEPEAELPVCRMIVDEISRIAAAPDIIADGVEDTPLPSSGDGRKPVVVGSDPAAPYAEARRPDIFASEDPSLRIVKAEDILAGTFPAVETSDSIVLSSAHLNFPGHILAAIHILRRRGYDNRLIIRYMAEGAGRDDAMVRAGINLGKLMLDGLADGLWIVPAEGGIAAEEEAANLAFAILQATRRRITATEYIACPSCGRTMFDLQTTLARVKAATSELRGLKIGVMGCIVNGPGEMADADYGYVGAAAGCVSLYKGKQCLVKNIPQEEAVDRLVALIKEEGDWK